MEALTRRQFLLQFASFAFVFGLLENTCEAMGCCSCFGFTRKKKDPKIETSSFGTHLSEQHLLKCTPEEVDRALRKGEMQYQSRSPFSLTDNTTAKRRQSAFQTIQVSKPSFEALHGPSCRKTPVKETHRVVRGEDLNGNKMINEYVREHKIGTGSYGKVVLHRNMNDGKLYAIKLFHKSRLSKLRVAPSETAMTDVLREVSIMKKLDHPNIVNLVEVIDDPDTDLFYMVLEYVEGNWIFEGSGPAGGIGEATARKYFKDIVAGLMYLHSHNIVHGDIKPENLLVSSDGRVKICDFSVSRIFEGSNDELRRSPGTPVFTAPECCSGWTYHGKVADVWALGVTLYCMVLGRYPFIGESLQDTYDKIVRDPLSIPGDMNPELAQLLAGLLCKDPRKRMSLDSAARHPWVVKGNGFIQQELNHDQGGFKNCAGHHEQAPASSRELSKSV